jgi:hypothetical protein
MHSIRNFGDITGSGESCTTSLMNASSNSPGGFLFQVAHHDFQTSMAEKFGDSTANSGTGDNGDLMIFRSKCLQNRQVFSSKFFLDFKLSVRGECFIRLLRLS